MSAIDWSRMIPAATRAAAARADLLARLAELRWRRECGGVTLADGTRIATDARSVGTLTAAVKSLQDGMIAAPIAWKFPTGWRDITLAELEACAGAVARHVQACFTAERAVADAIAAREDLSGFDLAATFEAALAAATGQAVGQAAGLGAGHAPEPDA